MLKWKLQMYKVHIFWILKGQKVHRFFSFLQWNDLCLEFLKEASNFYRFPKLWRYFSWNRISLSPRLNQVVFKQINTYFLHCEQKKLFYGVFSWIPSIQLAKKNPQSNFSSQNLSAERKSISQKMLLPLVFLYEF